MSLCNCGWVLRCHWRERAQRECVLSAISAAMSSVSPYPYLHLLVSQMYLNLRFASLRQGVCASICMSVYICPGASYIRVPSERGWTGPGLGLGLGLGACRWAAVSSCAFVYELPNKCVKCRRRYCHWRDTLPSPTSSSSHTRVCLCVWVCVLVCLLCMTFGNFAYLFVIFYLFLFCILITLTNQGTSG